MLTCRSCIWAVRLTDVSAALCVEVGECHAGPPIAYAEYDAVKRINVVRTGWPRVLLDKDFCGALETTNE